MTKPAVDAREFERCWPWLHASMCDSTYEHDGIRYVTHEKEHLLRRIQEGRTQFWPSANSAWLTETVTYPTGLRMLLNWAAGGELDDVVRMESIISEWAAAQGCHFRRGFGRRGWLRAFPGYVDMGTRKQKDLIAPGTRPVFDRCS